MLDFFGFFIADISTHAPCTGSDDRERARIASLR